MSYLYKFFRPTIFIVFYAILVLIELKVTSLSAFRHQSNLLAGAIFIDLVILPIGIFYFLVIKPSNRSRIILIIAAITFARVALFILPPGSEPFSVEWSTLIALTEIGLFSVCLYRINALRRSYKTLILIHNDPIKALHGSLESIFGRKIATIFVSEFKIIRFSLLGWWRLKNDVSKETTLTSYRESGQTALMIALLVVCSTETLVMHILLARWNLILAYLITGISLYSMMFLIADLVATYTRPSFIANRVLHLQLGIRWHTSIPCSTIASINFLTKIPVKEPMLLNAMLLVTPNTLIVLREPTWIDGPYGIRRKVQKIALFIDNKDHFRQLIDADMFV